MGLLKQCPQCKGEFIASRRDQTYCSKRCYNMAHRTLVVHKPVSCNYCGKMFTPKTNNQIYCTPTCRDRGQKNVIMRRVVCPICGETFETYRHNQIYCSDGCRNGRPERKRPNIKRDPESLKRKNETALSMGMSYGRYQALHSGLIPTAEEIISAFKGV